MMARVIVIAGMVVLGCVFAGPVNRSWAQETLQQNQQQNQQQQDCSDDITISVRKVPPEEIADKHNWRGRAHGPLPLVWRQ